MTRTARPVRRITSPKNPALQLVKRLQQKRDRREQRLLVAEGEDVVNAALDRHVRPTLVLMDADRVNDDDVLLARVSNVDERYMVPGNLLAHVSTLAAPPRVIAVFPQPGPHHFRTVAFPPSLALYLAGVADPGNVGTLVRTAAAFGCDWVALGPGSADAANPRAIRAAMGSTFAIPILEGVAAADLSSREGFTVVAAVAHGGVPPWEADLTAPILLALGAERAGLRPVMDELAGKRPVIAVTIPQADGAESLNVSAAGAAILAEVLRQRHTVATRGANRDEGRRASRRE